MATRYEPQGSQAEYEPGSRGRVPRNLLGIRSVREMAQRESVALITAMRRMIDETRDDQRFAAEDLMRMHRTWLGEIYVWAGEYRQVNMQKGGFMFAAAHQVPGLMRDWEQGSLRQFTPCRFQGIDEQARAMAVVHAELILIHPFRDGNGRCARALASLMGFQAGLPGLDFKGIRGEKKRRYIAAVHAALGRDYEPMTEVFRGVIKRTHRL